jgi:hypothetical protein
MLSGLIYLARAAGALLVIFVGLAFLVLAVTAKERSSVLLGLAAVGTVGGALAWPRRPNAWRDDKPTDRQLAFAKDLGIAVPRGISKGDLSDLISQAKAVRDAF